MVGLIAAALAALSVLAFALHFARQGEARRKAYEAYVFGVPEETHGKSARDILKTRMDRLLAASGVQWSKQTAGTVLVASGLAGAATGVYLTGTGFGATLLAIAFSVGIPYTYLTWRARRRLAVYLTQIPEALGIIASVLRAGRSVAAAVAEAGRKVGAPLGEDLQWAADHIAAGVSVSDSLDALGKRVGVQEFEVFAIGAQALRDTGGNLPQLCDAVAEQVRDRVLARAEINAVSGETLSSAKFMSLMPLAIFFAIRMGDPGAYGALLGTPLGVLEVVTATVVLPAVGYLYITYMVRGAT